MLTGTTSNLVLPAAIFLGVHTLVSGTPLRGVLVRTIGLRAYLALFSLTSLAGLVWMILAYREAPFIPIWQAPVLGWVGVLLMPVALLFAIAGYTTKGLTASGAGLAGVEDLSESARSRGIPSCGPSFCGRVLTCWLMAMSRRSFCLPHSSFLGLLVHF